MHCEHTDKVRCWWRWTGLGNNSIFFIVM